MMVVEFAELAAEAGKVRAAYEENRKAVAAFIAEPLVLGPMESLTRYLALLDAMDAAQSQGVRIYEALKAAGAPVDNDDSWPMTLRHAEGGVSISARLIQGAEVDIDGEALSIHDLAVLYPTAEIVFEEVA